MSFGAVLREARLTAGLTLEMTAVGAGCSTSYVHKLELGRVKTPSPRVLERLAKVLSLDYGWLMANVGYRLGEAGQIPKSKKQSSVTTSSNAATNATILRVLMDVRRDLAAVKALLEK